MIKAVFFDLDHTLYDRSAMLSKLAPAFLAHFSGCFAGSGTCAEEVAEALIRADKLNYRGWPASYARLAESLPWSPPGFGPYEAFMRANMGRCAVPWPETSAVLERCRAMGLALGMITNGAAGMQNEKIDALGIRSYFNVIVISGVFGADKPDPAIFLHAAALAGLAPDEIAFVGDNPENDVLGAAAAGMTPIWMDHFSQWPEGRERPEHTAHRFADVPEILEKLIAVSD